VRPLHRQILNFATLVVVLIVNALAGTGILSGESIGVIANRYPSYFLPADYVFGIWSLIYLGLAAFAVYQFQPAQRENAPIQRIGLSWAVNGLLNVAWIVAFSFGLFGLALLLMAALLANLVVIHERIGIGHVHLDWRARAFVALPFSAYFAWISVAIIANAFQLATYLGWSGFGLGGVGWSILMLCAGAALALAMLALRGNWVFPLVFAWAFFGIADRFSSVASIANTAYALVAVLLVASVALLARGRRRGVVWV
jgi:translocator protein